MPTAHERTGYQQSENGMLQSGMYACPSVYLVYPPDRTGRRPNQHTLLQYTSLTDRRYHENLRLIQQQQYSNAQFSRDTQHTGRTDGGYPSIIDDTSGQKSRHAELHSKDQITKVSQVEKLNDKTSKTKGSTVKADSPNEKLTLLWICCQNCYLPGPYSSLYPQCLGCNTSRCSRCIEMLVQESPILE
ncbi:hypothetical protein I7I48_03787 [Histoplasma ohiense]|nr:hypothetical protein I7I48_03787 [Histoplasma ohiense (nom. inval.)]